MNLKIARAKWRTHYKHAARRGVRALSFNEYLQKIIDAGISLSQIGRTHGSYQLGRHTDQGDYTVDSCRFITQVQNLAERSINGGTERGISKMRGKTKHDTPWLAERSRIMSTRNADNDAGVAKMAESKGRPFHFVHDSGAVMKGKNLRKYCRENNLETVRAGFNRLRKGLVATYRGWRVSSCIKVEENQQSKESTA